MNLLDLEPKYADYQIAMRRLFHTCPEASTKEFQTAKLIRAELDKMSIPWRECGMPTGTLATIKGARPGRTIILRGDSDGLEVTEKTCLEYASKNEGFMHACGHDCHISMLLTAGKILNDLRDRLSGTVVLCFQPAEEVGKGAAAMIADRTADIAVTDVPLENYDITVFATVAVNGAAAPMRTYYLSRTADGDNHAVADDFLLCCKTFK